MLTQTTISDLATATSLTTEQVRILTKFLLLEEQRNHPHGELPQSEDDMDFEILLNGIKVSKIQPRHSVYRLMYDTAHTLALDKTMDTCKPTPMIVQERANPLDDSSQVVRQYTVPDGMCGFAWIDVRTRNHPFSKWLLSQKLASNDDYAKSAKIWVHQFNQSYERKSCYAGEFAHVLRTLIPWVAWDKVTKLGAPRAWAGDRLD
jgi:hypothetical protein